MSKTRFFSSALDGQTVTLTATQGGVTRGPNTISAWKQPVSMGGPWSGATPASLTVTVNEVLPVEGTFAPYPAEWQIRVTGTSYTTPNWNIEPIDPPYSSMTSEQEDTIRLAWEAEDLSFQRCQFVVHTGDSGNYRNEWVGSPSHRDKSKQYGQICGHVYDTPGTYRDRSIFVYDDEGNWGTLALPDLVVADPNTEFDGASTIVVSPTSDWTGAPAHDIANRFTTFDAAVARFQAIKNTAAVTSGVRICVQSGASFTERARTMTTRDAKGVCLVDTYGGAARFTYSERNQNQIVPLVDGDNKSLFKIDTESWALRVANGDFDMGWDAASGRPTNDTGWGDQTTLSRSFMSVPEAVNIHRVNKDGRDMDPNARLVLQNLDIHGCGWFVYGSNNNLGIPAKAVATFANDCEFYDNSDYTFFAPQNLFVLGCKQWDSGNTDLGFNGRGRTMGTSRGWRGHPILVREGNAWAIYIRATYVESRGGWSGQGSKTGHTGGQPTFRLNSAGNAPAGNGWITGRGRRYNFCDSVFHGYWDQARHIRRGSHQVVENCLLVHDLQSGARGVLTGFSGRCSVRNNVVLVLDTSPFKVPESFPDRDNSRFEVQQWAARFEFFIRTVDAEFTRNGLFENKHNTFVCLRSETDIVGGAFSVRADDLANFETLYDVHDGHNVVSAPNLSSPQGPAMDTIGLPVGMRVLPPWMFMPWERKAFTLASSVANGAETPAIEYPIDWYTDATTGADYAGSGNNNSLEIPDRSLKYDGLTSDFQVGETVTNGSASAEIFAVEPSSATNGKLILGPITGGSFSNDQAITSTSGAAVVTGGNTPMEEGRWYQPNGDYPNSGGVQQGSGAGRTDTMTIVHDCNASGLVQGDGTGTHFKILNRSGNAWPPGDYTVILDRGDTAMVPETLLAEPRLSAIQTDFELYRPTTPQALDDGLGSLLWDFGRNLRPNAGYAISPTSGTNAAGALLPEM